MSLPAEKKALHDLKDTFYRSVLKDPLLQPLFGAGKAEHVDHLTAFTAESFGILTSSPENWGLRI